MSEKVPTSGRDVRLLKNSNRWTFALSRSGTTRCVTLYRYYQPVSVPCSSFPSSRGPKTQFTILTLSSPSPSCFRVFRNRPFDPERVTIGPSSSSDTPGSHDRTKIHTTKESPVRGKGLMFPMSPQESDWRIHRIRVRVTFEHDSWSERGLVRGEEPVIGRV